MRHWHVHTKRPRLRGKGHSPSGAEPGLRGQQWCVRLQITGLFLFEAWPAQSMAFGGGPENSLECLRYLWAPTSGSTMSCSSPNGDCPIPDATWSCRQAFPCLSSWCLKTDVGHFENLCCFLQKRQQFKASSDVGAHCVGTSCVGNWRGEDHVNLIRPSNSLSWVILEQVSLGSRESAFLPASVPCICFLLHALLSLSLLQCRSHWVFMRKTLQDF